MIRTMVSLSVTWMMLSCLMFLSCPVQGEDMPSERSRCPKGSVAYFSNCYALHLKPQTWMDAHMNCQKRPAGHLVSVLSASEASFVASLIKNTFTTYAYIWIGLHDPSEIPNGNGWEWSNRDMMHYSAWERTPPTSPNAGYCASVTRTSGFKKWKDYDCDIPLPYVCKYPQ